MREDLVEQLRVLREAAGLSVRDLASAVDGRVSTVGGYLSGKHLPTPAQTPLFRRILAALGVTSEAEQDQWVEAVARLRRDGGHPGPAPYRGLLSYDVDDAPYFHGRASTTEALLARVRSEPGLLAVVGMTGVGKSSLLRAGLMASWPGPVTVVVPGPDPIGSWRDLAPTAGTLLVVDQLEELFTQVPTETARSASTTRLAELAGTGVHVVLGLRADFFGAALADPVLRSVLAERFFVLGPMDETELRAAIIGPARAAGAEADPDLVDELIEVVLPRRAPGSTQEPGALPLLSHVLLATWQKSRKGRLTLADYRATGGLADAVQRSAEEVWSDLAPDHHDRARRLLLRMVTVDEDGVVTRRSATVTDPADRDLLEPFVAARLVVARQEDRASLAHEALLAAWPRLAEWVEADRAGLLSRRRLRSAAHLWAEDRSDDAALLRGGRLEAIEAWLADGDRTTDLEPLEFEYLAASRAADRAAVAARRRQVRTLRSWVAVAAVLALVATALAVVSQVARNQAVTDRERADDAQERALSRQVAGYSVTARETDPALAAQLALIAYRAADTLESRSALLDAAATATPGVILGRPGSTALAVSPDGAVSAVSNAADGTIRLSRMTEPLPQEPLSVLTQPDGQEDVLYALAWNRAGDRLVAGTHRGEVLVWDVRDPAIPALLGATDVFGGAGGVQSMAFDDQDRLWVAGPGGGESAPTSPIGRWRVSDTGLEPDLQLVPPTTDEVVVQAVAVTGDLVATGESTGRLRLWDPASPGAGPIAEWLSPDESWVNVLQFDPAGARLAVGLRSGAVLEYDVTDPTAPLPSEVAYPPFETRVNALAYNADGTELVAGGSASVVRVWRTANGRELAEWGQPAAVTAVGHHRDGVLVVTDGNLRRYPWPGPVVGIADSSLLVVHWSADGRILFSGASAGDGRVTAHRIEPDGRAVEQWALSAPGDDAFSSPVAQSADGGLLATGARSGTVRLWRTVGEAEPVQVGPDLVGGTGQLYSVTFSPDGRLLAAGGAEHAVRVWDVSDPEHPVGIAVLDELPGEVYTVSWSPDGTVLTASIVSEAYRAEKVWDITDPAAPVERGDLAGFDNYVYSSDFAPDGSLIAVTGADGTVRLFDPRDPALPRVGPVLEGPTDQVIWVDFSPDGRQVVVAGNDGLLWVWDIDDPTAPTVTRRLTAGTGLLKTVEFSPDGRWLAAGSTDGTTRLWPTDPGAAAAQVCADVTAPITERQWRLYLPEQPYAPPCG